MPVVLKPLFAEIKAAADDFEFENTAEAADRASEKNQY